MIDYKKLLGKYVDNVVTLEGSDFLSQELLTIEEIELISEAYEEYGTDCGFNSSNVIPEGSIFTIEGVYNEDWNFKDYGWRAVIEFKIRQAIRLNPDVKKENIKPIAKALLKTYNQLSIENKRAFEEDLDNTLNEEENENT